MRIKLNSVLVPDQEQALVFYTEVLGFSKAKDIPLGEYRWLTVVSPDEPEGAELLRVQRRTGSARRGCHKR